MATLEEFIRSGALGPVVIGMSLEQLKSILGEPQAASKKSTPLQLVYGSVQFSLLRSSHSHSFRLYEVSINFFPRFEQPPLPISISDWVTRSPSLSDFTAFLRGVNCAPIAPYTELGDQTMIFASGVVALIASGKLHSIRISERMVRQPQAFAFNEQKEPSIEQILQMLDEAESARHAGAFRAALLLDWAALEAAMRRRVQLDTGFSKAGRQPAVLVHELLAAGNLTQSEHSAIEQMRRMRTGVAHGLAPFEFSSSDLANVRPLVSRLLKSDQGDNSIK